MQKGNPMDSPWAVNIAQVASRPGQAQQVEAVMPAPSGVGDEYFGVPEGRDTTVTGRVESLSEGLLFTGSAITRVEGSCSLCLKDLSGEWTVTLSGYFPYDAAAHEAAAKQDDSLDDEGEDTYPLDESGTVMDLESLLRDSLVVSLPAQALCRPDCRGLCPECGANLNDDPGHHHEPKGTMWNSDLAALRDALAEGK